MDLLEFDLDNAGPKPMRVRNPLTGEPMGSKDAPSTITLYGATSAEFSRAQNKARLKAIQEQRSKQDPKAMSDQELDELAEKMTRSEPEIAAQLFADITAGVTNLSMGNVEMTKNNIAEAFLQFSWLRDQADEFVSELQNFTQRA